MGQGSPAADQDPAPLRTRPAPLRLAVSPQAPRPNEKGELRLVGVRVDSTMRRIGGAVVAVVPRGLESRPELLVNGSAELTDDMPAMFHRLRTGQPASAAEGATLAGYVADAAGELVHAMLNEAALPLENVLAIGIHEPGLWHFEPETAAHHYHSVCDAARLAEKTGINCIDAFPARDLACGGQGGPLTALPCWMLLGDALRTRVLLDLGRTTRLTYLPPRSLRGAQGKILSFDVGAGTVLTDRLVRQLTNGQFQHDPGGSLAVQGRKIPDLIGHWLSDPYFQQPPPRWYPMGVKPERELNETVRMAVEAGWSVRDLLCTATHFIAETIALAVQRVPPQPAIDDIVLFGGGQANGMLLREIAARIPGDRVSGKWGEGGPAWLRAGQLGYSDDVLEPVAAALLALLHLEQIPASLPSITGAHTPRVLGRLTPGSPQHWRRLVQYLAASLPQTMSLRTAI